MKQVLGFDWLPEQRRVILKLSCPLGSPQYPEKEISMKAMQ